MPVREHGPGYPIPLAVRPGYSITARDDEFPHQRNLRAICEALGV